jgi:Mechanosensitive ion channel, conserved TM helix
MDQVNMLLEPAREFLAQAGAFLPRLVLAVVVLVLGWLAARVARFAIERGLRAVNFNVLTERAGMDGFLRQGGIRPDTVGLFGLITYWVVVLAALIIAFNGLGLTYITDLLREIVLFVPRVIVALLILAFGGYFARFVSTTVVAYCRNVGIQDAEILGRIAQYAIIAFVVLIAFDQMDIAGEIVRDSFLIILAGVIFGLALAFGLGGRRWAAAMLEHWWPTRGRQPDPLTRTGGDDSRGRRE